MASQQILVSIKAGIRAKKGLHLVEGGSVAAAWQQRGSSVAAAWRYSKCFNGFKWREEEKKFFILL